MTVVPTRRASLTTLTLDIDCITDHTALHFACKAAAIGNPESAARAVEDLVARGATLDLVSKHTDMTPLHYASFFGCAAVVDALFSGHVQPVLDPPCGQFEDATPLHLAALAGSRSAINALLRHGANPHITDNLDRTPLDCAQQMAPLSELSSSIWHGIFDELQAAMSAPPPAASGAEFWQIDSRVLVDGASVGTIKFVGEVLGRAGTMLGVALDEAHGDCDGTFKGTQYFSCKPR